MKRSLRALVAALARPAVPAAVMLALLLAGAAQATTQDVVPLPAPLSEAQQAQLVSELRAWLSQHVADRHLTSFVDVDAIMDRTAARLRGGETREAVIAALEPELSRAYYAFASAGALHDDSARYRLPFEITTPRLCVQGAGGQLSHQDASNYHTFDFSMPLGTPVLAARAGVVGRVIDGFVEGGPKAELLGKANSVDIVHDDGTFASYHHLSAGIVVREGQRVERGEHIGASGNTGWTRAPHLHFSVSRLVAPGVPETLPILFGVGSAQGFVPEAGRYYGNRHVAVEACADLLGAAAPADASPALRALLPAFQEFQCSTRVGTGVDYFTGAGEPEPGLLRVRATPTWLALTAEDHDLHAGVLLEMWIKAAGTQDVKVEVVDPAGRAIAARSSAAAEEAKSTAEGSARP